MLFGGSASTARERHLQEALPPISFLFSSPPRCRGNPPVVAPPWGKPPWSPLFLEAEPQRLRSQALPGNEKFIKEGMRKNTDCSRGGVPDWWRQSLQSCIPRQSLGTRNQRERTPIAGLGIYRGNGLQGIAPTNRYIA